MHPDAVPLVSPEDAAAGRWTDADASHCGAVWTSGLPGERHPGGYVYMDDVRPAVESLVDRHPDLQALREDVVTRARYVACVLTSLFSSLHGMTSSRVTFRELLQSNLVEALVMCAVTTTDNVLPFSARYFRDVEALYRAVDRENIGVFTLPQLVRAVSPGPVLPIQSGNRVGGGAGTGIGGPPWDQGTVGSLPAG